MWMCLNSWIFLDKVPKAWHCGHLGYHILCCVSVVGSWGAVCYGRILIAIFWPLPFKY